MAESLRSTLFGRWRPGAGFAVRVGRRTLVESLYLLTAPVTAAVGLLLVVAGVCALPVGHGGYGRAAGSGSNRAAMMPFGTAFRRGREYRG
jgi:hypothetical protein